MHKFGIFLFVFLVSSTALGQELRGRVVSTTGKPITGASVQPSGMLMSAITDSNGEFALTDPRMKYFWGQDGRKIVFVWALGHKVITRILEPSERSIEIILETEMGEKLSIPDCSKSVENGLREAGSFVRIVFPKNYKIKKNSNFEYSGFKINIRENKAESTLSSWTGVYSTTYPPRHLLLGSSTFEAKQNGLGLDWKGKTTTGEYWRYVGGTVGVIDSFTYTTASERVAREFDKILGTMCVRPMR